MRPFALAVRRLAFVLAAVGMLLTVALAPTALARPGNPGVGKPTTLRILSFNIWFEGTAVPGGLDHVLETIRMTGANVIMLSEAGGATTAIAEKLSTPEQPYYAAASGDAGIVSAFPIVSESDLPYAKKAVLDVDGRKVATYSAHLYYRNYATYLPRGYGGGVDEPSEFAEYGWDRLPDGPVLDIDKILKVNEDSKRPEVVSQIVADAATERALGRTVFFGGDFNEPSAFDWTAATSSLFDHNELTIPWQTTSLLRDAGYVDAYRTTYPDPVTHPGFTWPSDNADKAVSDLTWAPEADERDRIDYVFHAAAPGVKLLGAGLVGPRSTIVRSERVVEDTDDNFLPIPANWPSDHKAVLATYRLAGGPARP
ncbi:endonuclease/exonuclease/phosphatase family protein [Actinopolymorpha alba]|uniref:endonuclease/exonuclease/phosphatase family protein n=1 Tax=Actinopolymorpha alba TaxID=533267 RepID=UPI0003666723|nr:endonuclease/exonuclease/phosphatase family protein [Actinopolymorpha alba]